MSRNRAKKLPTEPMVAEIESFSPDGRGVAHIEGKAVFIHGALPGEEVSFLLSGRHRRYDEGVVQEVLRASPDRTEPRCPHFGLCGGCSLQHMRDEAQIRAKEESLIQSLQRIGKVNPEQVLPPLTASATWGYRSRARLGVKHVHKKGRVLVGFHERGSSFIADLSRCEILPPRIGYLLEPLARLVESLSIADQIPQIEVALGDEVGALVFRLLVPPRPEDLAALRAFGEAHELEISIQEGGPESIRPLVESPRELAYGLPEAGVEIRFRPTDFTQVNPGLNRLMVEQAKRLLDPQADERLLDLFCGLGNFTLPLARCCERVVGVEMEPGLVQRARENAERNGIQNAEFFAANLYAPLDSAPWLASRFDKALLDPPRSGAFEILERLPKLGIRRILYVSCYPSTLARDAGVLVNSLGYRLRLAGVMDMFPHTSHVESMALFERPR